MTSNGRIELIVAQLNRIESKLDEHLKDSADKFSEVHGRISKVDNRVARVEVIGGALQAAWGVLITRLFGGE